MEVDVLGSTSAGNCYRLRGKGGQILIECGLTYKEIQKGLAFSLSALAGCLVSHEHMDHAKAFDKLCDNSVDLYMTKGTKEALGTDHNRIKTFKKLGPRYKKEMIGNFEVLPFETIHDSKEPVGFYIKDTVEEKGLMFITDTAYLEYKIPAQNILMIECNHDLETLNKVNKDMDLGEVARRNRVIKNHMSLETLLEALEEADLSQTKKIYLLHLSSRHANREKMLREVKKIVGEKIEVRIAE